MKFEIREDGGRLHNNPTAARFDTREDAEHEKEIIESDCEDIGVLTIIEIAD